MTEYPAELFERLRVAIDRCGMYSDHEGDEEGPTFHFWKQGKAAFRDQCERAIRDHLIVVGIWRTLHEENEKRP